MINLEIVITLVAMLVAFFIVVYMLQRGSARKRRIKKDYETLELAKQLKCDTRNSENLSALGLQPFYIKSEKPNAINTESSTTVIFSVFIFCGFLGWSYHLMTLQLIQSAALTLTFALTCVVALLFAKRKIKQGSSDREQLLAALEKYETTPAAQPVSKVLKTVKAVLPKVAPNSLTVLYELASGYSIVPEDSSLKRHFLSKLMAEIEASVAPRPTDSTLKRHHEAMIKAEFEQRLQALSVGVAKTIKPGIAKPDVAVKKPTEVMALPEDSMLRRHFLSQLRHETEACFGDRPTDSMLKRHYDSMVDDEFEKRVQLLSVTARKVAKPIQTIAVRQNVHRACQSDEHYEHIPEDSTLRRHFLTELKTKIVAKLPPKPTDFNLLRHYNAMVQRALERELEEHYL